MTVTGSAGKLITPHRSGARFILFTGGADVPTSLRDFSGNLDRLAEVVAKETSALQEHATATASTAHAFAPRVVSHWPRGFQSLGPAAILDAPFQSRANAGMSFLPASR